ncbi:MAG TPA: hypothetical protein VGI77_03830 [Gaiellaceae bacterium]|jgi:hypothetical protein
MRCAIVGSGLAALTSYATLRHRGVPADEIAVFGTHADPTTVWRIRASSIRQQRMRSESDGHLAAAAFPGLVQYDHWLPALLWTVTNRYRPPIELFLRHAAAVREESGWDASFVERRVANIRASGAGFAIDGEGTFPHVLLALGHPGLMRLPGTVHAYEPHDYAPQVAVIGAGMAAATEWRNARAAGSDIVSIRRREPLRRPLNVPRVLFSKRGLAPYHRLGDDARVSLLHDLGRPSYPRSREWDFEVRVVDEPPPGYQVIAATGFRKGFAEDALLADLVATHDLATRDRFIVLAPDSTVPRLTDEHRTLSVAGAAGQWAFPAADTIAGAKYAARAFSSRVCRTR